MALIRVGSEIREIDRIVFWFEMKFQDTFAECRGHAKPFLPVIGGANVIVLPAGWIRRLSCIDNRQCAVFLFSSSRRAFEAAEGLEATRFFFSVKALRIIASNFANAIFLFSN